ncbi:hypothetical protein [Myxococcus landrumensis]|uniref:Lipoprotein n=1 Tax=Myxococcus landrumensis TaxID=2813577 RepID=A0ABX7NC72_9BACT|nr:hypothetical protein [Myxococcus landrumus]QSQ16391.1 hypothetical protein JY572_10225 [Myxococcus landrumus]
MADPILIKRTQLGTTLVAAISLLGACGGPMPEESEMPQTGTEHAALEIPPPTVTMYCEDEYPLNNKVYCYGSASNGVPPYRYQWQRAHDLGSSPAPENNTWRDGTATIQDGCTQGLHTGGRYYRKYFRFRVLDANNYVSNYVEEVFVCWTPNP